MEENQDAETESLFLSVVETRVLAAHLKINIGNLKNGSLYWEVQDQPALLTSQDTHDPTFSFSHAPDNIGS